MAEDPSNDRPEKRCKLADGRRSTTKKDWFSSLPQSCSTNIFNYVAASPDDVMNMSFISKQSRKDCLHESIVQTVVPTIYFSSRTSANSSSLEMTTRTMLQKLKNHQFLMGNDKARSHYKRMKVTGVEEFGDIKLSEAVTITNDFFFRGLSRWMCLLRLLYMMNNRMRHNPW